jgi:hypothetical protein
MTQDIHGAVSGLNFEVTMIGRQPAVDYLIHFHAPPAQPEAAGCFFPTVTAIAFDVNSIEGIDHVDPACLWPSTYYSND